jgi:hypothetical protein
MTTVEKFNAEQPRTTVTVATTLARTAAPTWSGFELLPEGAERKFADHLRWTQMTAYKLDERTHLVEWRQD